MKTIYFAGGCFWGTEHYISQFEGVADTVVGYANGNLADPTYEQVYTDLTGHVECVKVVYDEKVISLATLCRLYFKSIDPLLKNRQGGDIGTRYRTGIYWDDDSDSITVTHIFDEVQRGCDQSLAVEISPLNSFYPAEEYHQDYLYKNPEGYCHIPLYMFRFAKKYSQIISSLRDISSEEKRIVLSRFFKTGEGEYGEGDKFLGVSVSDTRRVAKRFNDVSYDVIEALLESEWHECRLCALMLLIEKYKKDSERAVQFYLSHTQGVNNWDLVDLSAPYILGDHLIHSFDRTILYELSASSVMWEQRIAVVATLMLIRHGQFTDTMKLSEIFLDTKDDLIQKAVGWMLREVGKRDQKLLIDFLEMNRLRMPRTMLRYAIEKFPPEQRTYFMAKN